MAEFNFDEWVHLYKNYPEEYELKRSAVIESEIQKSPPHRRAALRLLQIECDAYHNSMEPIAAAVAISNLMDTKLNELKSHITDLKNNLDDFSNHIGHL